MTEFKARHKKPHSLTNQLYLNRLYFPLCELSMDGRKIRLVTPARFRAFGSDC